MLVSSLSNSHSFVISSSILHFASAFFLVLYRATKLEHCLASSMVFIENYRSSMRKVALKLYLFVSKLGIYPVLVSRLHIDF